MLPGVTVNATSPSMMGMQTTVSDTGGTYRFPALPPGTYNLSFVLPGADEARAVRRIHQEFELGTTDDRR